MGLLMLFISQSIPWSRFFGRATRGGSKRRFQNIIENFIDSDIFESFFYL
jgi:hypothetical protein